MAKHVYLDANFIIRLVESEDDNVLSVVERASAGVLILFTRELTLAEVLVGPMRGNETGLTREYKDLFADTELLEVRAVDRKILTASAWLRATLANKLPDSIHVATALSEACGVFLSSDRRIRLPDGMTRIAVEDAGDMDEWP